MPILRVVALALVAVLVVPAHATALASPAPAGSSCAAPPCGYINPILDLDFPTKAKCGGSVGAEDPSGCPAVPAIGESVRFEGTVRWYWKESEDLVYPPATDQPIVISFVGVPSNPSWMSFKVDPPTYTISTTDLFTPTYSKVDQSGSTPIVYYWYEKPINVTFTRTGAPQAPHMQDGVEVSDDTYSTLASMNGLLEDYVRAKSTPSGTTYNAGFGGEFFRFNATSLLTGSEPAAKASPSAWLAPTIALAAVALMRRRRA